MKKITLPVIIGLFTAFTTMAQTSFMSYNIKYANETDGENSWSKRKAALTDLLKFQEPDVLGVQEALLGQLEHIGNSLEKYDYVGAGREDGKEEGEFTAIFFDTRKFELLEENTFWLSPTPNVPSLGWDASYKRVCTYALLREKGSGKRFWIFNTHFDHQGDEARKESARLVMAKIETINTEGLPLVLMGDFNLEPEDEPIKYISGKLNDSKKIATEVVFGPEGTFNAYEFMEPVNQRIDYIFTSRDNVVVKKYAVLNNSYNLKYPADHLPVYVEVDLL